MQISRKFFIQTEVYTRQFRGIACTTGKQTGIFYFKHIPWDFIRHLDLSVVRIHVKPHGLDKIKEGLTGEAFVRKFGNDDHLPEAIAIGLP